MIRRMLAAACMVAVLFSFSAVWTQDDEGPGKTEAEEGVKLRYKFEKGDKFVWKAENNMALEITEMPEEFEGLLGEDAIDIDFNMTLKLKVKEVKDGKTVFEGKFQKLKVVGNLVIQEIDFEYDADEDDGEEEEDDLEDPGFGFDLEGTLRDMVREPVDLTITDRGEVTVKSDAGQGFGGGMGGGLINQFLSLNGFMGKLPKKEIEEGAKWKEKSDFNLAGLPMNVKIIAENKLQDLDEGIATIKSNYKVGTSGSDEEKKKDEGGDEGGLPFAIDAMMTGKGKGTTRFNADEGRVVSGDHKLEVDIEANLENPMTGDDMTIEANLTFTQKTKLEKDEE